ncbi:DUF2087 domain-containing protein [Actinosynnema sp. NPDC020468]|uniref:DUF2087 domain-containing protein n=1 Tax=Actinosynnema sp. NPDC020468 TaxID=3154488 RepID=UPI003400066F
MAALVLGARTAPDVVLATGLDAREVDSALRRLRSSGLVAVEGGTLVLREELFDQAARTPRPPSDPFVNGGRLTRLPAQRAKRRAVLEQVCASFEPGTRYPEREVVSVLRGWCDGGEVDHVTVRRYLVDEGLLDRADGEYWRSGGPVV